MVTRDVWRCRGWRDARMRSVVLRHELTSVDLGIKSAAFLRFAVALHLCVFESSYEKKKKKSSWRTLPVGFRLGKLLPVF